MLVLRRCGRERAAATGCASRADAIKGRITEETAPERHSSSDNNNGIEWYLDILANTTTDPESREARQSRDGACHRNPSVKAKPCSWLSCFLLKKRQQPSSEGLLYIPKICIVDVKRKNNYASASTTPRRP